jgi:hypothetical protein
MSVRDEIDGIPDTAPGVAVILPAGENADAIVQVDHHHLFILFLEIVAPDET